MISLDKLQEGKVGYVVRLRGGTHFVSRLAALGFTPGAAVEMVRNYGRGPVIVMVRGTQIALGRGQARHVLVRQGRGV